MARRRKRSRKLSAVARRSGLKGSCKSAKCAQSRYWTRISSGTALKKRVPKACAIVQSGPKKGKLRKGCKIHKSGAFCDATQIERLPSEATRRVGGRTVKVVCK